MNEKTFAEGIALLLASFPNLKPDRSVVGIWQKFLCDIADEEFMIAVANICRDQTEIYPGTNIIATIRSAVAKSKKMESLHPGPEEAWGIALSGADENRSIVWTDEIAQAAGASHEQLKAGDTVGARMAFLEKYRQLVSESEKKGSIPIWSASLGFDKAIRDEAWDRACLLNRKITERLQSGRKQLQ